MPFVLSLLAAIAVAVVTGLGSAWLVVGEGLVLKTVRNGVWSSWPGAGLARPDPYSRAVVARTGQVPLGPGEGVVFFSSRDAAGDPIRGGCDYLVAGTVPEARLWTLEVVDAAGDVAANALRRYYMSSREVVRMGGAKIEIALSPTARPGNWLPIAAAGQLTVILRLYDPQGGAAPAAMTLPTVTRRGCA